MYLLQFITWEVDPEIFNVFGRSIRWYGFLFALGFVVGQRIVAHFFKKKGYDEKLVDSFVIYSIVGTVVGARLGHCLFYGPYFTDSGDGYFDNPISILYVWEGGLASHGAMFGLIFSTYLFYKKKIKEDYLWITDRLVITVALAGCFIRFGNLMNSEIIGVPTNASHGVVFSQNVVNDFNHKFGNEAFNIAITSAEGTKEKESQTYQNLSLSFELDKTTAPSEAYADKLLLKMKNFQDSWNNARSDHSYVYFLDDNLQRNITDKGDHFLVEAKVYGLPRHPSQLYESISSLVLFFILFFTLEKKHKTIAPGIITGMFFTYIFTLRFFYEFLKEVQVDMEQGWALNMGQILSIPAVIFGIAVIIYARKKQHA